MDLPVWPHDESPFHTGERLAQQRAGKAAQLQAVGRRLVRAEMPEQHRLFYAQLPFLVVGGLDRSGWPAASLLTGAPGFAHAPGPRQLRIDAIPSPDDPLADASGVGADIGLLGIELPTRRRNRMNGMVSARDAQGMTVDVRQSFGNCPRYIQQRVLFDASPADARRDAAPATMSATLDADAAALIGHADTIFIASFHQDADRPHTGGADVSHRGGNPGFVRVEGDSVLLLPDFNGNAYFNTIGNLLENPRAGLVIPDFDTGTLLHVAVRAQVLWDGPQVRAYAGAERVVRMEVRQVVRRPGALPLRAALTDMSPVLADTGPWRPSRDEPSSSVIA